MKMKIAGLFMAFLFCISMVGTSFAASPLHNTFIGKTDFSYAVKYNEDLKIEAWLYADNGPLWYRYLDFYIYDLNGTLRGHTRILTTYWCNEFPKKAVINPEKWNLSPGDYELKIKYEGCTATLPHYAPCQQTASFKVY
jgi:hypothetical protein